MFYVKWLVSQVTSYKLQVTSYRLCIACCISTLFLSPLFVNAAGYADDLYWPRYEVYWLLSGAKDLIFPSSNVSFSPVLPSGDSSSGGGQGNAPGETGQNTEDALFSPEMVADFVMWGKVSLDSEDLLRNELLGEGAIEGDKPYDKETIEPGLEIRK